MPARKQQARPRQRRVIWAGVGLATAARTLRDRRLQETAVTWIIGLAALARLGRDNQSRLAARLVAWDKRLSERYRHKARAQG